MVFRQSGQNFSVEGNAAFLESSHKGTVGASEGAQSGVHLHVPSRARHSFLPPAMGEGVGAGVGNSFSCLALLLTSAETVALHLRKDISPALHGYSSSFNSWHGVGGLRSYVEEAEEIKRALVFLVI